MSTSFPLLSLPSSSRMSFGSQFGTKHVANARLASSSDLYVFNTSTVANPVRASTHVKSLEAPSLSVTFPGDHTSIDMTSKGAS